MGTYDIYDDEAEVPHPGEILREDILPKLNIGRKELARHLGISTWMLVQILSERRPVTFDIAMRLGAAIGYGARYWIGLQAQYDMARAISLPAPPVAKIGWRPRRNSGYVHGYTTHQERTNTYLAGDFV